MPPNKPPTPHLCNVKIKAISRENKRIKTPQSLAPQNFLREVPLKTKSKKYCAKTSRTKIKNHSAVRPFPFSNTTSQKNKTEKLAPLQTSSVRYPKKQTLKTKIPALNFTPTGNLKKKNQKSTRAKTSRTKITNPRQSAITQRGSAGNGLLS